MVLFLVKAACVPSDPFFSCEPLNTLLADQALGSIPKLN